MHTGGHPNHRGSQGDQLIKTFCRIGQLAPGSYGLLYVHDDEDPVHATEFRVNDCSRRASSAPAVTSNRRMPQRNRRGHVRSRASHRAPPRRRQP
ncbi:hypothetical protein GFY24_11075 [Nocardia sp. SYP-A9097]|uniref:Imm7 family immunity protein n=1 Tax=Nocardia sp. SYP-A9097 TaxID=2663237 RepID=UPI0013211861|nr:Imm7 family immunity protein [Nocardia sp. SYP-A9097]MRH87981.1 hypothetical protein [Nocardia sp. SYP-A9097]